MRTGPTNFFPFDMVLLKNIDPLNQVRVNPNPLGLNRVFLTLHIIQLTPQKLSAEHSLVFFKSGRVKGALCAYVIRLRVSYNQNDETLSRNSLRYLSKSSLKVLCVPK